MLTIIGGTFVTFCRKVVTFKWSKCTNSSTASFIHSFNASIWVSLRSWTESVCFLLSTSSSFQSTAHIALVMLVPYRTSHHTTLQPYSRCCPVAMIWTRHVIHSGCVICHVRVCAAKQRWSRGWWEMLFRHRSLCRRFIVVRRTSLSLSVS